MKVNPILSKFQMAFSLTGKYCEEYLAQHKKGDAGVPDGTVNCAVDTMSQTVWRTLNSED